VAAGALAGAAWRLHIDTDGTAILDPAGLALTATGIEPGAAVHTSALLATASDLTDIARVTPIRSPVAAALEQTGDDGPRRITEILTARSVEVALLGPTPTVTGW